MYISKLMPLAQIIQLNPIINESYEAKRLYYFILRRYINMGKWKSKYVRSMIKLYAKALGIKSEELNLKCHLQYIEKNLSIIERFKLNLTADIYAILGYDSVILKSRKFLNIYRIMLKELNFSPSQKEQANTLMKKIISAKKAWYNGKATQQTDTCGDNFSQSDIMEAIKDNVRFLNLKPARILVTATMSAGKSTFINAIIGKSVNLSQNLACTSKIHSIVNKPYEDNFSYEYDYDLELDADKHTLYDDNEKNLSNYIMVGTYFNSEYLDKKRCVIIDSPGVNSSENDEHRVITERIVTGKKYDLIVYVLNSTQLGTYDDEAHLRFICRQAGKIPIIFIANKIDAFNDETGNVQSAMENQIEYLKRLGFNSPIVCPVSSTAAFLAKKALSGDELSKIEFRQLDNYIIDFGENDLSEFYENHYRCSITECDDGEEKTLLKQCGMTYIEQILSSYF